MRFANFALALLLMGIVDQIHGDDILIEYESNGRILYSHVSLTHSACKPVEGQRVFFYRDYKIVTCEGEKG